MHSILRQLLFLLPEETAHRVALQGLNLTAKAGLAKLLFSPLQSDPVKLMGLTFKNRIGIAAGLDNNADFIHGLAALGVGHIEVGGVTPKPQPGNDKPRVFRLVEQQAIINRKGFPNKGVKYLANQLKNKPKDVVIGVNIGKNKDTPLEGALDDYTTCIKTLNEVADYITVNISSPNTPGLRELQTEHYLDNLLAGIKQVQHQLPTYVPIAVKIAPDLETSELSSLINTCNKHNMDALIATNTTLQRVGVEDNPLQNETGGLSGRPLKKMALSILEKAASELNDEIALVGVGGCMSAHDINERLMAGAQLVQVYTGLIYNGAKILKYYP